MPKPEQIDIAGSRLKLAGLFLVSCGLVAGCTGMLVLRPHGGAHKVDPGSFAEFALALGILFFGAAAVVCVTRFVRGGPVVSVGPRGIFDRRLSSDWIPWEAIDGIGIEGMQRQRWLALKVAPAREDGLPLHAKARFLARLNRGLGSRGYSVGANDLTGGLDALLAAIEATAPARLPVR